MTNTPIRGADILQRRARYFNRYAGSSRGLGAERIGAIRGFGNRHEMTDQVGAIPGV
jgi:hypothetical protein